MPSTRIETRAGWLGDRHDALIAMQSALIKGNLTFKVEV